MNNNKISQLNIVQWNGRTSKTLLKATREERQEQQSDWEQRSLIREARRKSNAIFQMLRDVNFLLS